MAAGSPTRPAVMGPLSCTSGYARFPMVKPESSPGDHSAITSLPFPRMAEPWPIAPKQTGAAFIFCRLIEAGRACSLGADGGPDSHLMGLASHIGPPRPDCSSSMPLVAGLARFRPASIPRRIRSGRLTGHLWCSRVARTPRPKAVTGGWLRSTAAKRSRQERQGFSGSITSSRNRRRTFGWPPRMPLSSPPGPSK